MRLHPEHGLNPCIPNCYCCNKEKNQIAFLGDKIKGEAPRSAVIDKEPCEECRGYMKQGIILISTRDGESGDNPYRTGGWWVITQQCAERLFNGIDFNKQRVLFIEDSVALKVGLKKGS